MGDCNQSQVNIVDGDPSFQGSRFTGDILSIARLPTKGVDGDWEKVFQILASNGRGLQYLTASEDVENGRSLLHYACNVNRDFITF